MTDRAAMLSLSERVLGEPKVCKDVWKQTILPTEIGWLAIQEGIMTWFVVRGELTPRQLSARAKALRGCCGRVLWDGYELSIHKIPEHLWECVMRDANNLGKSNRLSRLYPPRLRTRAVASKRKAP